MSIKKDVAIQLRMIANSTPLLFEWIMLPTPFLGEDLNLTPLKTKDVKFESGVTYEIPMPHLRAVEHYQQLKDAYKKNGWQGVKEYHRIVIDKIKAATK